MLAIHEDSNVFLMCSCSLPGWCSGTILTALPCVMSSDFGHKAGYLAPPESIRQQVMSGTLLGGHDGTGADAKAPPPFDPTRILKGISTKLKSVKDSDVKAEISQMKSADDKNAASANGGDDKDEKKEAHAETSDSSEGKDAQKSATATESTKSDDKTAAAASDSKLSTTDAASAAKSSESSAVSSSSKASESSSAELSPAQPASNDSSDSASDDTSSTGAVYHSFCPFKRYYSVRDCVSERGYLQV
jgi:hypothetical protein